MSTLIMCPGCGQTTTVDPAAGGRVLCRGCGKSLTRFARADSPLGSDFAIDLDEPETAGTDEAMTAVPPRPRLPMAAVRRTPTWVGPVVAAAGAVVLAGGGAVIGYGLHRPATAAADSAGSVADAWEARHRGELFALKADAEARVLAGDLAGGHAAYRQLSQLAGTHPIRDPALADLVRAADADQQRVYAILLAKAAAAAPASPTAPSPAAAAAASVDADAGVSQVEPKPDLPTRPAPAPAAATPPVARPGVAPPPITPAVPMAVVLPGRAADRRVTASLDHGIDYLIARFRNGQLVDGLPRDQVMMHQGLDALCVYALLHAAEASTDERLNPHGPFMSSLIQQLKAFPMATDEAQPREPVVYARSLRAAALAVFNRPEDHNALRADVAWLVRAQTHGAYTYDDRYATAGRSIDGGTADGGTNLAPLAQADPRQSTGADGDPPVAPARQSPSPGGAVVVPPNAANAVAGARGGGGTRQPRGRPTGTNVGPQGSNLHPMGSNLHPMGSNLHPMGTPAPGNSVPLEGGGGGGGPGSGGGGGGRPAVAGSAGGGPGSTVAPPPAQRPPVNPDPSPTTRPAPAQPPPADPLGPLDSSVGPNASPNPDGDPDVELAQLPGQARRSRPVPGGPGGPDGPGGRDGPGGPPGADGGQEGHRSPLSARWDNSNSQYGLLGVWAGAEAGVEVPQAYWKSVEQHWLSCQTADGQWYYSRRDSDPRLSMTCAGVASLLVTHEWLDAAALGTRVGRPPYSPQLSAGLKWLEAGDHVTDIVNADTFYLGYSAYGVERCALASGFKFFGTHDWFKELADQLIAYQFPTGGWGQADNDTTTINTAYMVLFLSRGRHPVLMNKLRMDPYWDNRPRDLANLTQFASKELERPFNWQVVSFARPWSDWMDAPVLYVASHTPPKLTADDEAKLKAYADAGGMIFTHADSAAPEFTAWADGLAKRLWPDLGGLKPLPSNHELYSVVFHLTAKPPLSAVSNGTRLLMVHSPTDLSPTWQERTTKSGRETFGLGVNLFVWAAGKTNFRNRLDTPFIPDPPATTAAAVPVARLRYAGGTWDPEPYAWTRFARYFQWTTGTPLAVSTVDLSSLTPGQVPVAVLTGSSAVTFTDADAAAVRGYVTAGGTLLVDACGSSPAFAASAEALLGKAFAGVPLTPLPDADPVIRGGAPGLDDLSHPAVRSYAAEKLGITLGGKAPPLRGLTAGTGRVVYANLDLTTGLLDTNSWGIVGYTPTYAQAAVKNVVLTAR